MAVSKSLRVLLLVLFAWGGVLWSARAQTYTQASIPVSFTDLTGLGTGLTLADDAVTSAIALPFTFEFFGTNYSSVYVSSNGFITFLASQPNGCCAGATIPNAAAPNGFIAGSWNDLFPPGGGTIRYHTVGSAPARTFIVMFRNVPNYSSTTAAYTFNIKLFEATKAIEIHIVTANNDGSNMTVGLENAGGTLGVQTFSGTGSLSNVAYRYTPASLPPVVTTLAASGVTQSTATINATVNPNGVATTAIFRYGTDPTLATGTDTVVQSLGSGTSAVAISQALSGLLPLTTYYFRASGTNLVGTSNGAILNFTTLATPPTVVTLPATGLVPTGALLNGTVNPNGASTDVRFQYSTDPGLAGATLTPIQNIGAGTATVPVSAPLSGLVPKTTYYFRAVATNSGGTVNGAILSFTTNVVNWGGAGSDPTAGILDPTLIPTTGTHTFTNVNGQGYNIVVTTSNLNAGGSASYFGDSGWWFEGGGPSYGYGTVTFRFYDTVTGNPYPVSGVDFRLLDAEKDERFRGFGYWNASNTLVPVAYGTGRLTFSHTPIYHATDGSYDNSAARESGNQLGKWIEFNLADFAVTGFTFQAHRETSGAGSVVMGDLISPFAAWRTANFGVIPYPLAADDFSNPDNDGPVNVIEYFYGTNPNVADIPNPQVMSVIANRLAITFPRSVAATDTTATVEGADSAAGPWTGLARSINGAPFAILVPNAVVTETGAGLIRTVEVRDEYLTTDPLHPMRFLRLQVVH